MEQNQVNQVKNIFGVFGKIFLKFLDKLQNQTYIPFIPRDFFGCPLKWWLLTHDSPHPYLWTIWKLGEGNFSFIC